MAQRTEGTDRIFDRETLLDLTVNFIPLGIILFFLVLFPLYNYFVNPFGTDIVATTLMIGLHVVPFVALAILTYFAGKVITEAERRGESETAESVASSVIDDDDFIDATELPDGNAEHDHETEGESESAPTTDEQAGTDVEGETGVNTTTDTGSVGEDDSA